MNADMLSVAFEHMLKATLSASILAILIALIQVALGQRLSPRWRYLLWMPVVLRLLVPVLPESQWSMFNALSWGRMHQVTQASVPVVESSAEPPGAAINPGVLDSYPVSGVGPETSALQHSPDLIVVAAVVCALVSAVLLLRLGIGVLWLTFRLRRRSSEPAGFVREVLLQAGRDLGCAKLPGLRETDLIESPAIFGASRPLLLVPQGFSERLSTDEMRHVFLHELAHLKRRDLLGNWFMEIARALHWFNPFVWFVCRQMRLERELACDEIALRADGRRDPKAYGSTILRLMEETTVGMRLPAVIGIAEAKHAATRRLQQIATFPERRAGGWLAFPMLILVTLSGLTNAQSPTGTTEPPAKTEREGELQVDDNGPKNEPLPKGTSISAEADVAGKSDGKSTVVRQQIALQGIHALEAEWKRQREMVRAAEKRLQQLREELQVTDIEDWHSGDRPQMVAALHALKLELNEKIMRDGELLRQLKSLSRSELRNALPTALETPDKNLNRYLEMLAEKEQQYASISTDYSEKHPSVQKLAESIVSIEGLIEHRIDGILKGLEVRQAAAAEEAEQVEAAINKTQREIHQRQQKLAPFLAARRKLENEQRILDTIFMRILAEKVDAKVQEARLQNDHKTN